MAKSARKTNGQNNGSTANADAKSEGVAPYFRPIFAANRRLLKTRSNKELLKLWLADHPGFAEVPTNVKSGLANLKSVLRKSMRSRRKQKADATATSVAKPAASPLLSKNRADSKLEHLEMLIDDCLTMAKVLDREGLDHVIKDLRRARNEVVWKLGGDE